MIDFHCRLKFSSFFKYLLLGTSCSALIIATPALKFLFIFPDTFIHEIGHLIFFWIFGYFALPGFFFDGNGFTMPFGEQNAMIQLTIFLIILNPLLKYYHHKEIFFTTLFLILSILIISQFPFHYIIILFMGHGMEAIFGTILVTRLLFCSYTKQSHIDQKLSLENSLLAIFGFYFNIGQIYFFTKLLLVPSEKNFYINNSITGAHGNDLSKIAIDLNINIEWMFFFTIIFSIICLALPIAVYLIKSLRDY